MTKELFIFSGIAGATVFIGGLLANFYTRTAQKGSKHLHIIHGMESFGAGILLSALALVLVPYGLETLEVGPMSISFSIGVLVFFFISRYLSLKGGRMGTLLAMMLDFVPESIALGAMFVVHHETAILLSIFIGLQNLPEAFNAFSDLKISGYSPRHILIIFFFLSFFGIIGAVLGQTFLSQSEDITAHLMVFASGGILYLLFEDIIPESKLNHSFTTPIWATLGFLIGIIGEKVI